MMRLEDNCCFALSHSIEQRGGKQEERLRALGLVYDRHGRGISGEDFARIAYLGIVQIGFAYLLFTLAMARGVRSLDAGIIGYIEPVLNPIWVFLFIGARPSGWAIVGGVIIIASVLCHMTTQTKTSKTVSVELTPHE